MDEIEEEKEIVEMIESFRSHEPDIMFEQGGDYFMWSRENLEEDKPFLEHQIVLYGCTAHGHGNVGFSTHDETISRMQYIGCPDDDWDFIWMPNDGGVYQFKQQNPKIYYDRSMYNRYK